MRVLTDKKGLSPVVATIILSSVVVIIGISMWSFAYTVSDSLQESYYEEVQRQIDAISERFTVEHIAYDNNTKNLYVWVYNYGKVSIHVDVYVTGDAEGRNEERTTSVPSGKAVKLTVALGNVSEGSELAVKVISVRGNEVYEAYVFTVK